MLSVGFFKRVFICGTGKSEAKAKQPVVNKLKSLSPKSADSVELSPRAKPQGHSANQAKTSLEEVKKAKEKLRALQQEHALKKELSQAKLKQQALLRKAKTEKKLKVAEKIKGMSVEEFNQFDKAYQLKRTNTLK